MYSNELYKHDQTLFNEHVKKHNGQVWMSKQVKNNIYSLFVDISLNSVKETADKIVKSRHVQTHLHAHCFGAKKEQNLKPMCWGKTQTCCMCLGLQ